MTLPASQPNFFDSSETGAPALNNVAGSALEVIRACLRTGFNSRVVTSIVVAAGVATATAASHGYSATYGQLLLVEGAPETLLNGRKQPLSVTTNTFTFAAPGVADGTYTGTMSAKRAPLGWTEPYTGTNKAIFARSAIEANDIDLRVDDSGTAPATTTAARFLMVKGATGVDTYTSQAPTEAQVPGGFVCTKVANTATAKQWLAIGTDRDFFLFVGDSGAARYMPALCFFDGVAYRVGDAHFTVAAGTSGSSVSSVSNNLFVNNSLTGAPSTPANGVIFSDEIGLGGPEALYVASPFKGSGGHGDSGSTQPTDPLDFVTGFDLFMRGTKAGVRGTVPGYGEPFINGNSAPAGIFVVQDTDDGQKILLVRMSYTSTNVGMTAFKLSREWR